MTGKLTEKHAVKENMNKWLSIPVIQQQFSSERKWKEPTESHEKGDSWGTVALLNMEAGESHSCLLQIEK